MGRLRIGFLAKVLVREYGVFLGLLVLFGFFSGISPVFRSIENLRNLFNQQSILGIATVGMAVVIWLAG